MDLEIALKVMRGAVTEAGEMLLAFQPEVEKLSSSKDFLTDADLKSEEIILASLQKEYPDTPVFSEEKCGEAITNGFLWVIDPVDGTINYFLQDDHWEVSIALVENGKTVAGVVYLPAKDLLFYASQRVLTKVYFAEWECSEVLKVNKQSNLKDCQIWLDWGKEENAGADHEKVYRVIKKLDQATLYPQIRNSCTSDMLTVAMGKIAGYVFPKPEPFDIAAAGLIVECAGGKVTDMEGNAWSPFSKSLVATNGKIHGELIDLLNS